jgi:hypothetical protein
MKKSFAILCLLLSLQGNTQSQYSFYNIGLSDSLIFQAERRDLGFHDVLGKVWLNADGSEKIHEKIEFHPFFDFETYRVEGTFISVQYCYNGQCQTFNWDDAVNYFVFNIQVIQIKPEELDQRWAMVKE